MFIHLCNYQYDLCASGYANEVGEAFRSLVPVSVVRLSYVVASGYVCADAYHKGDQAQQVGVPCLHALFL